MNCKLAAGFAVAAVYVAAGSAFAQQQAAASGPRGIAVGPLMAYPGIDFAHGYDDNLFSRQTDRRSSSVSIVSPYVKVEGKPAPHSFEATFRIDSGNYHSNRAENYTDYSLGASGNVVISGRASLGLSASRRYGHDARGSTDRAATATPDEYTNTGFAGTFGYGAPGAQGAISVDGGWFRREYQNNRATTAASDRDTAQIGGIFYWRVAPKTQLLFNAQHSRIDYDQGTAATTQDSTENRIYVGAKWDATALTQGTAKFGRMTKSFDAPGRQDVSDSTWDIGVRWSPLTYSVFDFTSSKLTSESTGVGDSVVGKLYAVTWTHAWDSRLRSQALLNRRDDSFVGASSRKDETDTIGLKVSYQFRRWLRFGLDYTFTDRASNDPTLNYRKNVILFTLGATL